MEGRRSAAARRSPSPAQRGGWSATLSASVVVATAAHLAVFALAPRWEAPAPIAHGGPSVALLQPVASAQARVPPPGAGPPEAPESPGPAAEPPPSEGGDAAALAALDRLIPTIVQPGAATPIYGELRLEPLALVPPPRQAQMASASDGGLWRDILNVEQVLGFLRARYNGVLAATGLRGHAVIQVWVDHRGRVAHSEVHDSSGQEALDRIALELFTRVARFAPRSARDGGPLTTALISVPFQGNW